MKNKIIYPIFILLSFILMTGSSFALTGREIMEKSDALKEAKTSIQKNILLIIKGDKKEKKEFSGIMKKYGKNTRSRISFSYPTRLEFLVWDKPGYHGSVWVDKDNGHMHFYGIQL